ncbi:MAG TPA: TIR domain-containing protein, partial [Ktedonobacteraceae bacterium]|nr:TIR domain-containing protein [Ktedonobacteraceae bacterium]
MIVQSFSPVHVSYYFDPADRTFCEALDRHIAPLKQSGRIQTWDMRQIAAGQEWKCERDLHLSSDQLLLFLISPDFLASEIGQQEMQLALRRHADGEVVVLPILIRPSWWQETELQTLQMLPREHKALASQPHPEEEWQEIIAEISRTIALIQQRIFVAYAPEDSDVVERLHRDLTSSNVELWNFNHERHFSDLSQRAEARDAIRQASLVLLVASPAAASSQTLKTQRDLAADYHRPILLIWARGEDWEQPNPRDWGAEEVLDARGERYETTRKTLLARFRWPGKITPSVRTQIPFATKPRNPYKGLRAFTARDTRDFFGRDALVGELATTLEGMCVQKQQAKEHAGVMTVLGASGSGKSSVVLAGLLPHLQQGGVFNSQEWIYLDPIVPGTHPLEALAVSLAQQPSLGNVILLHRELRADSVRTLHLLASQLVSFSSRKVVLFIDQFEEVFTLTSSAEERQHFFDLLATAVTELQRPLLVILALRADFYDRLMQYPVFYRLLEAHRVSVLPMEREDLRQIIERPGRLPDVQITFEGDLVGDLLFDMREQGGALPLLQFTLDQLFARRDDHQLTLQAYREIGGIKGALTTHAESVYASLPGEAYRKLARALFLRLVEPGRIEQDTTRRRAVLEEFTLPNQEQMELLRETIDILVIARLLTTNEIAGAKTIEISHEALIRAWPRLNAWLNEARVDIRLQQTVSKDAAEWQSRHQPGDRLYRGSQLREAQAWARRNTPSRSEEAFLRASVRQRQRFVANMLGIALLLLATAGGAALFYLQFQQTRAQIHDTRLVTNLQDNGTGSLRWAIANASSGSTITFDSNLGGHTIALTSDLHIITRQLSIQGLDAKAGRITISNQLHQTVIEAGSSTNIFNLSFTGGKSNTSSLLFNKGTLTITNSIVSGNTTSGSGGGGIENDKGKLTLTNSTISGNTATGGNGGGIKNSEGTLLLIDSTISRNTASITNGGGIENDGGTVILTRSTIADNTAFGGYGGGVNNTPTITNTDTGTSTNSGKLTLINSTISGNIASGNGNNVDGGGIYGDGMVL